MQLHQPHPLFTAGNILWELDTAPSRTAFGASWSTTPRMLLTELDTVALRRTAPGEIGVAVATLAMHNFSVITDLLPQKMLMQCGSDLERWYPWPRRLVGIIGFLTTHRKDREHWRRALDTVRELHGIAGGVRGEMEPASIHE